jgi:purine nucleosidase
MGGLVHDGASPWPPVLETNLNADPEAARIVFASGIPLTVVPIDVTTQVFLGPEHRAEVRSWDTPLAVALVGLMEQMREGFVDFSDLMGLPPDIFKGRTFMHDPLAIAAAVGSPFVTTRRFRLRLEVRERVLRTIPADSSGTEAAVCVAVDAPAFVDWWLDTVRRVGGEAERRSGGQQLGKEHA